MATQAATAAAGSSPQEGGGVVTIESDCGTYRYVGQVKVVDGCEIPHGKGRNEYIDTGDVYEGDFHEDSLHGQGTYRWSDGLTYVGQFVEDRQHGYGELTDPSGEVYKGQWVDDVRHGKGKTMFPDGGGYYEGDYANNEATGHGRRVFADGSIYEGQWLSGMRHGKGMLTRASGDVYEGSFANDQFSGEGRYRWADGRMWEGTFANGLSNGKGKEYLNSETVLVGTWKDSVPVDVVVERVGISGSQSPRGVHPHASSSSGDSGLVEAIRAAIAAAEVSDRAATAPIVKKASPSSPTQLSPDGPMSAEVAAALAHIPNSVKTSVNVTASILPPSAGSGGGGIDYAAALSSLRNICVGGDAMNASGATDDRRASAASPLLGGNTSVSSAANLNASTATSVTFSSTSRGIRMDDLERYKAMNLLGRGSFGAAYEAVLPTGRTVCVKTIELCSVTDPTALASLYNEISLMQRLHHPHIVDFYGCIRNEEKQTLNIFMEYVTGGSLVTYARKFKAVPAPTVRRWAYQMVCGVKYLHDNKVVHRDIKGDNILMTNDGVIKLADFGCSKALEGSTSDVTNKGCTTMVGTPYWMAPEVIMCSKESVSSYGTKADIWSVGCTIVEMITGKPPWPECASVWRAIYQIANATGPPPMPDTIQGPLRDFLLAIFERDPLKRPSADELLLHPYLAGYDGGF